MRTLVIGLVAIAVAFVSGSSHAAIFDVTVVGDGFLVDPDHFEGMPVGPASLTFSYDTADFSLLETYDLGDGGTGSRWTVASPVPLTVVAGGVNYGVDPMTAAAMFDQPTSFDQFDFFHGGSNILMQWNDSTSSAWGGPVTTDFEIAHALFIDQEATNPSLGLANGSVHLNPLDGNHELSLRIENADVTFVSSAVPEPCTFLIWSLLAALAIVCYPRQK